MLAYSCWHSPARVLRLPVCVVSHHKRLFLTAFIVWLTIATRLSWPVSTTYSVVAAITGVGIASAGWDAPKWGWNGAKGLGAIFSGLLIGMHIFDLYGMRLTIHPAPALSGCIAVFIYLIIKYGVLLRKEPTRWGLLTAPLVFFFVGGILTMAISTYKVNFHDISLTYF